MATWSSARGLPPAPDFLRTATPNWMRKFELTLAPAGAESAPVLRSVLLVVGLVQDASMVCQALGARGIQSLTPAGLPAGSR